MITLGKAPAALLLCLSLCLTASGCSTLRGAPAPLVKPKDLESKNGFKADDLVQSLIESGDDKAKRDQAIVKLLALSDIRYAEFRNDVASNRKHSKAAADGLSLLTDIAATLTDSVGVKDNYIAFSALLHGGQTIYDKDYLFDRTLDALIAQMDANRKSVLVNIRQSMLRGTGVYPPQVALSDILDYYHAGTINGAILGVQKSAAEQQARDSQRLQTLKAMSDTQIAQLQQGTDWVSNFVDALPEAQLPVLQGFLAAKGETVDLSGTVAERRTNLKNGLNDLRDSEPYDDLKTLIQALRDANFKTE